MDLSGCINGERSVKLTLVSPVLKTNLILSAH